MKVKKCKQCNRESIKNFCNEKCKKDYTNEYQRNYYKKNKEYYRKYRKEYYKKHKDVIKKSREKNKEKIKNQRKEYYKKHKDRVKKYQKENKDQIRKNAQVYYKKNKDEINRKRRLYYKKNKEKINKTRREYVKKRKENDPIFKLRIRFNSILYSNFTQNGYTKRSKTYEIIGCSFEELKKHLESQFEDWMSWDNHGLYNGEYKHGWDIDHIIPVSSAETEEDVIRLNHYTNFQPLCSKLNRNDKRDRFE